MKAFVIKKNGTISDIERVETDYPPVGKNQVLVRVKSAAVNPADIKVITIKSIGADHALDYRKTTLKNLNERFDIILDAASNSSFAGGMTKMKVTIKK